jgi:hypothetical protein
MSEQAHGFEIAAVHFFKAMSFYAVGWFPPIG